MEKILSLLAVALIFCGASALADKRTEFSKDFRLNRVQSEFLGKFGKISPSGNTMKLPSNPYEGAEKDKYKKIFGDSQNLAFLLYEDGELKIEHYADRVTDKLPLFVYSITKSFIGLSAVKLSCDKGISLDSNLGDYSKNLKKSPYESVSLRNALKMQSGFNKKFDMVGEWETIFYWKETIAEMRARKAKLERKSGQTFLYDGNDTDALAQFIEDVSGKSLDKYVRENFVAKAGLQSSIYWLRDKSGTSWGRVGLMATPRDLIRLSLRYIDIIEENECVKTSFGEMSNLDKSNGKYGFQVWLPSNNNKFGGKFNRLEMHGFGGQFIFIERATKKVGFVYSVTPNYKSDIYKTFWKSVGK